MNPAVIAAPQNLYSTNDDELLNATDLMLRLADRAKSINM
jgi:hypothetical protein